MDARVVAHLQDEQLSALGTLPDSVDAGDGGALQPHGHQGFPHLLISVVLKRDTSFPRSIPARGQGQHQQSPAKHRRRHHSRNTRHFSLFTYFYSVSLSTVVCLSFSILSVAYRLLCRAPNGTAKLMRGRDARVLTTCLAAGTRVREGTCSSLLLTAQDYTREMGERARCYPCRGVAYVMTNGLTVFPNVIFN